MRCSRFLLRVRLSFPLEEHGYIDQPIETYSPLSWHFEAIES
jgi:hypothetical protein